MESKEIAKQLCHLDEESCAVILSEVRRNDFGDGYEKGYQAKTRDSVNQKNYRIKSGLKRWGDMLDKIRNEISDRYKLA